MFGGVGLMLHGNMCVGVRQTSLIVRLGPEQAAAALKKPNVVEFDVAGRPMKGWVMVEAEGVETDGHAWVDRPGTLVLDGQQRITSLFVGLRGSYRYFRYKWRKTLLYLNLLKPPVPNEDNPEELTYEFAFRESADPSDGKLQLWYPVGRILDFKDGEDAKDDLNSQLGDLPEEQRKNANRLISRLHNRIHTDLVGNYYEERSQEYEKVLQVFVRANSGGQPLEYSDLLLATATAKWETLDAPVLADEAKQPLGCLAFLLPSLAVFDHGKGEAAGDCRSGCERTVPAARACLGIPVRPHPSA